MIAGKQFTAAIQRREIVFNHNFRLPERAREEHDSSWINQMNIVATCGDALLSQ
jgi:hypothetical protein